LYECHKTSCNPAQFSSTLLLPSYVVQFSFFFDLWFQEFQITGKAKTWVFFFHFLFVYTKIHFACQDGKAAPLSVGKFGGHKECWDCFVNTTHCIPQNMQQLSSSLIVCILYGMG